MTTSTGHLGKEEDEREREGRRGEEEKERERVE